MLEEIEQQEETPETLIPPEGQTKETSEEELPETEPPAFEALDAAAILADLPEDLEVQNEEVFSQFVESVNKLGNGELDHNAFLLEALGLQRTMMESDTEAIAEEWTKEQEKWEAAVKEEAGANYNVNIADSNRMLDQVLGSERAAGLREVLAITGLANNPDLFKVFATVAEFYKEGAPVTDVGGGQEETHESVAASIFPSMKG